jgi:hypothetical protein
LLERVRINRDSKEDLGNSPGTADWASRTVLKQIGLTDLAFWDNCRGAATNAINRGVAGTGAAQQSGEVGLGSLAF